jgi:hypothetical protein
VIPNRSAHILQVGRPIRMNFVTPLSIPPYLAVWEVRVSESAQGPLFGRIERQSVSRAFLDPWCHVLSEEVAWRIDFAYWFSAGVIQVPQVTAEKLQPGRESCSDTGYQSEERKVPTFRSFSIVACPQVPPTVPRGSSSTELDTRRHQCRTIRRDLMILATTPTLVRTPRILGSLGQDWNPAQTQLKRPLGKAEILLPRFAVRGIARKETESLSSLTITS